MAYIVGILTPEQRETLERRGWEIEPCPQELIPHRDATQTHEEWQAMADRFAMVFVDTDMFTIMSGPDWDTEEE